MVPDRVVDLPAHPGVLQHLGHGVPVHAPDGVGRRVGDEHRPARRARGVDGARERHEAVRVRRPEHRAVVVVAEGERVGQRVVEGQVRPAVVAHGEDAVLGPLELGLHVRADEGLVGAAAPAQVLARASCGRGLRCTRRCPRRCRDGRGAACGRARRARPGRSSRGSRADGRRSPGPLDTCRSSGRRSGSPA